MLNTTLIYLERDGKYLMLHRVKKEHDINRDKWIGVGGKCEENETPEECALREIKEETGFSVKKLSYRGLVTFVSDQYEGEYMHLFTGVPEDGTPKECDEGTLEWIPVEEVPRLPSWEGDKLFLQLLKTEPRFFTMKLRYEGANLAESSYQIYGENP